MQVSWLLFSGDKFNSQLLQKGNVKYGVSLSLERVMIKITKSDK